MTLLMYGAGAIGRGFVGALFAQAGYHVIFVDIDRQLVEQINKQQQYTLAVVGEGAGETVIQNVSALDGGDRQAVVEAIAQCDVLATSLGIVGLQAVAPVLAEGFQRRLQHSGRSLDILICENMKHAATQLKDWMVQAVPEAVTDYDKLGLVETAIGRMVPLVTAEQVAEDPLKIYVEEYDFMPVDKDGFVGEIPAVPQMVPYSPFTYYESRKLYLHNMGHATCAYLGKQLGYQYIWSAMQNPAIHLITREAMTEAGQMLAKKYSIPVTQLYPHIEDLLFRFQNKALGDTCQRVARDPLRKLGATDRFAAPLRLCYEQGMYPGYLSVGMAAALLDITANSIRAEKILRETSQLTEEQIQPVLELHSMLQQENRAESILYQTERQKKKYRGNVV